MNDNASKDFTLFFYYTRCKNWTENYKKPVTITQQSTTHISGQLPFFRSRRISRNNQQQDPQDRRIKLHHPNLNITANDLVQKDITEIHNI